MQNKSPMGVSCATRVAMMSTVCTNPDRPAERPEQNMPNIPELGPGSAGLSVCVRSLFHICQSSSESDSACHLWCLYHNMCVFRAIYGIVDEHDRDIMSGEAG